MSTAADAPVAAETCPEPVTPSDLIHAVRDARSRANTAEVDVLILALEWAHAHPDLAADGSMPAWQAPFASAFHDGSPDGAVMSEDEHAWFGIPPITWSAPASFAAANQMSTTAGRTYLRDALVLCHRLPRIHARVLAGEVPVFRARRVAQSVLGRPRDVLTYVDQILAPIAGTIGSVLLDRVLDQAMLTLYPEQRELDQLDALDACHVTLDEATLNHTGIAEMFIRGDWSDLKAFEITVSTIAAALKQRAETNGEPVEPLDLRRSQAVGILADPDTALALLAQFNTEPTGDGSSESKPARPAKPLRTLELVFHLSEAALFGCDPVGRDHTGRPFLTEVIRAWANRTDTHVIIRPVIDLNEHRQVSTYAITGDLRFATEVINPTCVFPHCTKASATCDQDHTVPFDHTDPTHGGPSCTCNIAPLCRTHHNLKTHAGWTYTPLDPGVYLWVDTHGQKFLRTPDGTRDVTPERPRPAPSARSRDPVQAARWTRGSSSPAHPCGESEPRRLTHYR